MPLAGVDLSRYQKTCIGVGLIAFIAVGVYAPWIYHTGVVGNQIQEFRFNASLLSPPDGDGTTQIDIPVLLVRWLLVIATTIALALLFSGIQVGSSRVIRWVRLQIRRTQPLADEAMDSNVTKSEAHR
jgi:hypothetical protein